MSGSPPESAPQPAVLFVEPGAGWRTVAYGPLLCLIVLLVELAAGWRVHAVTLSVLAIVLAAFAAVQVAAARQHVCVELTATTLRNGTESLAVGRIAEVFPERAAGDRREQPWESARSLGELADVPRRRTAIGLRLHGDDVVRTWARDHRALRAALAARLGQEDHE